MDRSGGSGMKMEVESKFNVGDRVRIDIYDKVNVVNGLYDSIVYRSVSR